ncbi:retrotransposon protein, putative, ty1-copia subclass, partial [Tanacetum coccineum]
IVDDYSRRVWVHFLRHKNETFKEWKQLVENQTGRKLKKLRKDNGLEFCNQEFNNLCKESGIARHLTIRSGAEATVTEAYLINRSPSTSLEKKTPMDLWSGHPANYEMLRIFGCVAYSHDTLKGARVANSGKEVEFKVELQGSRVEPTVDPHTGAKRTTDIPARYRDEGNVSFSRPSGSKEAINSFEKDEWVHVIEEEMVILSLTAYEDYELEQLDVKMEFLHGILQETIYMRQPPGFEEGTGNKVCLLKKSLYGLTQSLSQWYKRFDMYMIRNGFSHYISDSCVYFKEFVPGMYIYLLLYVDDMLIACKSKFEIEYTKGLLQKECDMKELGPARKILGMEIVRVRGRRTLTETPSGFGYPYP